MNTTNHKSNTLQFGLFPTSTHYFDPSPAPFVVNYIVDDLDALLDRLKQEGIKIDAKRMDESCGRFAWIYDLDGNKIELWQPQALRALRTSASLLLCDRKLQVEISC